MVLTTYAQCYHPGKKIRVTWVTPGNPFSLQESLLLAPGFTKNLLSYRMVNLTLFIAFLVVSALIIVIWIVMSRNTASRWRELTLLLDQSEQARKESEQKWKAEYNM